MVRVLLLFSSSELGGAERSLTRMALAPSTVEYRLGTLNGEGTWCDWVRELGHEPVVFGNRKGSAERIKFSLQSFAGLWRYARREQIGVIYVCGVRAAFVLRLLKLLMPGVRIVHGVRWNPASDSKLDRWFRFIERWFGSFIDYHITNSQAAADTLVKRCGISPQRVGVIYNGIADLPKGIPSTAERPLQVLTVANLNPRKGHRAYLNAIRQVLAEEPSAQFVFVGRDDMNGEIQRAIEDAGLSRAVRCEGFRADVSHYLRQARVFVLPSLSGEGCPTSLLESFAWGCAVVAYKIDGIPELVDDGEDGFLVAPGDLNNMAVQIIRLLKDADLADRLGKTGRKKVIGKFSIASCAGAHQDTFAIVKALSR